MPDLKKVSSGDEMVIPAGTWNAVLDVVADRTQGGRLPGASRRRWSPGAAWVLIKNNTGGDLGRLAVVGLGEPVFDPTADAEQLATFQSQVSFGGATPAASHAGRFAVLAEQIPAGEIGRAVVAGVTPVLLNVVSATDAWAEIEAGQTGRLITGRQGSARILWKDAGTGVAKWGVVLLNASDVPKRWAVVQANWASGNSVSVKLCADDAGASPEGSAITAYIHTPVDDAGPRNCRLSQNDVIQVWPYLSADGNVKAVLVNAPVDSLPPLTGTQYKVLAETGGAYPADLGPDWTRAHA